MCDYTTTLTGILERNGLTRSGAPDPASNGEVADVIHQLPEANGKWIVVDVKCPRCGKRLSVDIQPEGGWATRFNYGLPLHKTVSNPEAFFLKIHETECLWDVCGFHAKSAGWC